MWLIFLYSPFLEVALLLLFTLAFFSYSDVVTFLVSGNSWRNLDTSSQSTSIDMTSDASEAYYHTKKKTKKNNCYFTKNTYFISRCEDLTVPPATWNWRMLSLMQTISGGEQLQEIQLCDVKFKSEIKQIILCIQGDFFNWPSLA